MFDKLMQNKFLRTLVTILLVILGIYLSIFLLKFLVIAIVVGIAAYYIYKLYKKIKGKVSKKDKEENIYTSEKVEINDKSDFFEDTNKVIDVNYEEVHKK